MKDKPAFNSLEEMADWLQVQLDKLKKIQENPDLLAKKFYHHHPKASSVTLGYSGQPESERRQQYNAMYNFAEEYYNWRKEQEESDGFPMS